MPDEVAHETPSQEVGEGGTAVEQEFVEWNFESVAEEKLVRLKPKASAKRKVCRRNSLNSRCDPRHEDVDKLRFGLPEK